VSECCSGQTLVLFWYVLNDDSIFYCFALAEKTAVNARFVLVRSIIGIVVYL